MSDYDQMAYNLRKPLGVYFPSFAASLDLGRGTAFPTVGHDGAAVQAGARFWRTDIGFACYYDGTRWLTAHEYVLDADAATTPADLSGPYEWQMRQDYNPYFTRVSATVIVATTNNGTNFWTIRFRGLILDRSGATTIHDFTTAADSAGGYILKDAVPTSSQTPANDNTVQVFVQKTLSPGALTIVSASVAYRLIIP